MKYYYNDQLIRTSKNHIYSHAVVYEKKNGDLAVVGCRRSFEEAEALYNSEINRYINGNKNINIALQALISGKSGYFERCGNRKFWIKFEANNKYQTVEAYQKHIEDNKKAIEWIKANYKIIELEAR